MNSYEEELQHAAERGESVKGDNLDERSYQVVFRALGKDPGYELSPGFAQRVVSAIVEKRESRNFRDYVWFGAGILFLIISFFGTVLYTGLSLDLTALDLDFPLIGAIADYKGLIVFGVLFIAILNWFDKRVIQHRQHQN